jgi:predicted transcriptional regulator
MVFAPERQISPLDFPQIRSGFSAASDVSGVPGSRLEKSFDESLVVPTMGVLPRYQQAMSTEPIDTSQMIEIRIPSDLAEQISELARATGMTENAIAVAALHAYIAADAWRVQDTLDGLAEADRGEFASKDEVKAVFRKYGA